MWEFGKALAAFSGGVSHTRPTQNLDAHNLLGLRFLDCKRTKGSVRSDVFLINPVGPFLSNKKNTWGKSGASSSCAVSFTRGNPVSSRHEPRDVVLQFSVFPSAPFEKRSRRYLLERDLTGLQGYLAHNKNASPKDPTVGLCLGS